MTQPQLLLCWFNCTPSLPSYPASTVLLLPLLFVLPSSLFFSFFCVPLSITLYCVCTNYCIALLCILKHKGKGKCSAIKLTNNEEKLPPALLKKKSSLLCRLFFISFRRCLLIHLLFILWCVTPFFLLFRLAVSGLLIYTCTNLQLH